MCEDKAKFIQMIFSLDITSQRVLKLLIEQVMSRVEPITNKNNTTNNNNNNNDNTNDELLRANEMIRHLQEERHDLLNRINDYEIANSNLNDNNNDLTNTINKYEKELAVLTNINNINSNNSNNTNDISNELLETKRELDIQLGNYTNTNTIINTNTNTKLKMKN